jgi:hypothetical protein
MKMKLIAKIIKELQPGAKASVVSVTEIPGFNLSGLPPLNWSSFYESLNGPYGDFIHDWLVDGRAIKCLSIVDEFSRECLELRMARSLFTIYC